MCSRAGACLFERLGHHLGRDARHLDVHLQRGDALRGAGDLEVHVAVVILGAGDVGEDGVLAGLLVHDQAHRNAGDRRLDRHAGIHHRHRPPQTDAIDEDPFDSRMSETMRMV